MSPRSVLNTTLITLIGLSAATAQAQVGEPTGFTITIKHGGFTLAQRYVTVGPGMDLQDIKISDGDPEDFVQIGTVGGSNPMILKVVTEDDPIFRIMHMYIDVPISTANIHAPGPVSLFNPLNASLIDVEISSMTFSGGTNAQPQLPNDPYYYTSFMRDYAGHFYESVGAHPYNWNGNTIYDIQVPATQYVDGNPSQYHFTSTPGVISSWKWGNIVNPGTTTTIHNGTSGGLPSTGNGYVFELGLSVAFTQVPEPAVGALLIPAYFLLTRRVRRVRK